jgi:hypothetical protein
MKYQFLKELAVLAYGMGTCKKKIRDPARLLPEAPETKIDRIISSSF